MAARSNGFVCLRRRPSHLPGHSGAYCAGDGEHLPDDPAAAGTLFYPPCDCGVLCCVGSSVRRPPIPIPDSGSTGAPFAQQAVGFADRPCRAGAGAVRIDLLIAGSDFDGLESSSVPR